MANIIKLYRNGITAGKPGMNKNPPKRGRTTGWSASTSRRMTKFLYSIDHKAMKGLGYSFTLTIKDCPKTPKEWQMLREAFFARLKRRGLIRLQWLTEWQLRGVPHLHGFAYFDGAMNPAEIKNQWVECAKDKFGANRAAQDSKVITDAVGWDMYLSKHAVRGQQHYQRDSANMPRHWVNSGRMWGKWGDWENIIGEPIVLTCDDKTYYRFRRLIRAWRKSKAREEFKKQPPIMSIIGDKKKLSNYFAKRRNITKARKLLKSNSLVLSQIRGVNEFVPLEMGIDFMVIAKSHFYGIVEDK